MEGETINPWNRLDDQELASLRERMPDPAGSESQSEWIANVRAQAGGLFCGSRD